MRPRQPQCLLLASAALLSGAAFSFRHRNRIQPQGPERTVSTVDVEDAAWAQLPKVRDRARLGSSVAWGTRCTGRAPATLGQNATARGGRAAEILRELWACRLPVGVLAVGANVKVDVPGTLRHAVASGPEAAKRVLTAVPAEGLPTETVNWASGGLQLAMPEERVVAHLRAVFEHIEEAGLSIEIRAQDLFHGHVVGFPPVAGGAGELGILFHAKEYPEDLALLDPKGVGSGYTTQSAGYAERNLLYLSSLNQVFVIDPVHASNGNHCLLANLEIAPWLPDYAQPENVRTIDEGSFMEVGAGRMLDVSLLPRVLAQPDGEQLLFTKA